MSIERPVYREAVSTWPRVKYAELNGRQKEIYNFQKLAALLSDFGFNCIKLSDDWNGADFIAFHHQRDLTLRVQLKGGLEIHKKYQGKGLHMAFPIKGTWYLIEHDLLVDFCGAYATYLDTKEWNAKGWYYTATTNAELRKALEDFALLPSDA